MNESECVKCGAKRQPGDLECPQCGVIYAKAERAAEQERQRRMDEARARADTVLKELQTETTQAESGASFQDGTTAPSASKAADHRLALGFAVLLVILSIVAGIYSHKPVKTLPPEKPAQTDQQAQPRPAPAAPSYASLFVSATNVSAGQYCHAEIRGFWGSTLRISWTPRTNKLMAMQVLALVGEHKEELYNDGIRYFQFPNNIGGYNEIDWKTGEKRSISDQAIYFFRD